MSESYLATQVDARTFGDMQTRLISDINRPDLGGVVISYLQDAIRFMQRKPFFFNDADNTVVPNWVASTVYPQGSTIFFTNSGSTYVAVALNAGTSAASGPPSFPTTIFTIPSGFPPPTGSPAGTVNDNGIIWATVENATAANHTVQYWTQLTAIYNINQYVPPIDYVAPRVVEITVPALRYAMLEISYPELRSYDVIRPSPVTSYPTWWAWYQQQLYLFPYPQGFYPITLSYRTAPPLLRNATDTNFWSTKAEALIRNYAAGLIQQTVLYDGEAAQTCFNAADRELRALVSQGISQASIQGIPSDFW